MSNSLLPTRSTAAQPLQPPSSHPQQPPRLFMPYNLDSVSLKEFLDKIDAAMKVLHVSSGVEALKH